MREKIEYRCTMAVTCLPGRDMLSTAEEVRVGEGEGRIEASVCWCTRAGPVAW